MNTQQTNTNIEYSQTTDPSYQINLPLHQIPIQILRTGCKYIHSYSLTCLKVLFTLILNKIKYYSNKIAFTRLCIKLQRYVYSLDIKY